MYFGRVHKSCKLLRMSPFGIQKLLLQSCYLHSTPELSCFGAYHSAGIASMCTCRAATAAAAAAATVPVCWLNGSHKGQSD